MLVTEPQVELRSGRDPGATTFSVVQGTSISHRMPQQPVGLSSPLVVESTDLVVLAWHLALTLAMSHVLAWHYGRFAQVLSDRRKLARVMVLVSITTLLVINVVKSSLALSLGLVGALSIIRFRTPIKEPEELAYLFLAVALGVGMGADRPATTLIVFAVALAALALRSPSTKAHLGLRTIVQVQAPANEPPPTLDRLMQAVIPHCARVDLRRVDLAERAMHASLLVELSPTTRLQALLDAICAALPGANVSAVERDALD